MKKYKVRLEFKVKSIDLLEVEVEAENREEAIKAAEEKYINDPEDSDMYASDYYEATLDTGNMDVDVSEIEPTQG